MENLLFLGVPILKHIRTVLEEKTLSCKQTCMVIQMQTNKWLMIKWKELKQKGNYFKVVNKTFSYRVVRCCSQVARDALYGAECSQKIVRSRPGFTIRQKWKTPSVNPAVNRYLFRIREEQCSPWREMGSIFHLLCPRYSGPLTPSVFTVIRLWETFIFLGILTKLEAYEYVKFC